MGAAVKNRVAMFVFGVTLVGHAACGGRLADDGDATAFADGGGAYINSDGGVVCRQFEYPPSSPPVAIYDVTCPTLWRCDLLPFGTDQTSDRGFVACCPPGTKCQPTPCNPQCAKCDCIETCCPAGMWCDDWDAAPTICDGG